MVYEQLVMLFNDIIDLVLVLGLGLMQCVVLYNPLWVTVCLKTSNQKEDKVVTCN